MAKTPGQPEPANANRNDNKQKQGGGGGNKTLKDFDLIVEGPRHKLDVLIIAVPLEGQEILLCGGSEKIPDKEALRDPVDSSKQFKVTIENGRKLISKLDLMGYPQLKYICFTRMEKGKILYVKAALPEVTDETKALAAKESKKVARLEVSPGDKELCHDNHRKELTVKTKNVKGEKEPAAVYFSSDGPCTLTDKSEPTKSLVLAENVSGYLIQVPASGKITVEVFHRGLERAITWRRPDTDEDPIVQHMWFE